MSKVEALDVLLYGKPIGTLTHIGGDRTVFAFSDAYANDPDRPTLSLGFKDEFGALTTEFRPYRTRLMPFFSNLLPEGRLREFLAKRAGVNPEREFALLRALGRDLPGAIATRSHSGDDAPSRDPADRQFDAGAAPAVPPALQFSLAGVHLKVSGEIATGGRLTVPASGAGGSWIVKFPSARYEDLPENEYSMMSLARTVGIEVPAFDLIDIGSVANLPAGLYEKSGGRGFAVERFDRTGDGGKVHIEDFAQVFGVYPEDKYKKARMRNIADVVATEGRQADIVELVRRIAFNVLIGNGDMHLKNWSLIYRDRRNATLAPAYDFVSTIPYLPNDDFALRISRTKALGEISRAEFSHLAAKAALPEKLVLDTVTETVDRFLEAWKSAPNELPLSKNVVQAISALISNHPLCSR